MKNILKVAVVAVVVLVAGYGVCNTQKEALTLSDLMLENVEALAYAEYLPSPNPGSKCVGGRRMCYMGQGNVWGMN